MAELAGSGAFFFFFFFGYQMLPFVLPLYLLFIYHMLLFIEVLNLGFVICCLSMEFLCQVFVGVGILTGCFLVG